MNANTIITSRKASLEERWDWIITFMVVEDKFVHEILMMMQKSPSTAIETMGVAVEGSILHLYYNPAFVETLTDPELRYVVTHEIYHVALHHVGCRMPEDPNAHKLYNIAADLAINSLIPVSPERVMPKYRKETSDVIVNKKSGIKNGQEIGLLPKQFGFPEKLSMEQYVMLLREKFGNNGEGLEGIGGFDNHDKWAESEVIKEVIRNKIEQMSKKSSVWGSMPGDIKELILAAQRSQVRWSRILKQYLGLLPSTKQQSTFTKPHRRYGWPYCGTKRHHVDRKLVGVDDSGSIDKDDLSQFLTEVNTLAEVQPVDLQVFDDGLQGPTVPFDKKKAKFDFKGRGGTCFQQIMDLAEKKRYQSLIILTDGCAAAPTKPKYVKDIIWVITGKGNKPPVDWGKCVWVVPKGMPQPSAVPAKADDDA